MSDEDISQDFDADNPFGDFDYGNCLYVDLSKRGFSLLEPGVQDDGVVLDDLGWFAPAFADSIGIEAFIGIEGFSDEAHFMDWMQARMQIALKDWDSIRIMLYQCWVPFTEPDIGADDSPACYRLWEVTPRKDAAKVNQVTVYALRHRRFSEKRSRWRDKAFICARQRSYAEARWAADHPDKIAGPEIMRSRSDKGIYLRGKSKGRQRSEFLCWPTDDLTAVLTLADELKKQEVEDLFLCEGGFGYPMDRIRESERQRLLAAYYCNGPNGYLTDMVRASGI